MKALRLAPVPSVRLLCAAGLVVAAILLLDAKKPWTLLAEIGEPAKISHFVAIYGWWAGAANAILLALLGITAPFWLKPLPAVDDRSSTPRWFWPLVLAAMALTAFWGLQRISHSLWDDEENTLRRAILGEYRRDKGGEPKFRETSWETALWNYKKPTNHQFQTVLSKISVSAWRAIARPTSLPFTESAVRFPCLIAGILSVGAIALLLKRLGFPAAGAIAAFLLALHPWHIRYAVELRGYVFTLLFGPLMVYFLLRAIESGRWRWWLAFGAAQLAVLYSYPGCIYLLAITNACGAVAVLLRRDFIRLGRLLVASTISGMVYLQLMLPCIPQAMGYFASQRAHGGLYERWYKNLGAHFLTGTPWNNSDTPTGGYQELQWVAEAHPAFFATARGIVLVLLALGILRLFVRRPDGWLVAMIWLVPGPLVYFFSKAKGYYIYEWYLLFTLPGLIGFAALALDFLAACAGLWKRFAQPSLAGAAILAFAVVTTGPRQWLLSHSIQPMRESVLLTRPTLAPHDSRQKNIITAGMNSLPIVYDVHVVPIDSPERLRELAREADATGKPLFFNYGNQVSAIIDNPRTTALVEDERYFEKIATLPGFDPSLTRYVRRYRPGTLP